MPQRHSNLDDKIGTNSKVKDFLKKKLPKDIHFEHLVKVGNYHKGRDMFVPKHVHIGDEQAVTQHCR